MEPTAKLYLHTQAGRAIPDRSLYLAIPLFLLFRARARARAAGMAGGIAADLFLRFLFLV